MCHQAQTNFRPIFIGFPQYQKGYLVNVPNRRKKIYLYNVVFDDIFSSALEYMSQPYKEAMHIPMTVSYIPYAPSSKIKTDDIITLPQFEEGYLLPETHDDTESGNESDDYSTLKQLISEEEMDVMSSGYEYDAEPMSTDMLEDIRDGSQSHMSINRIEARYNIRDHIKQGQVELKVALLSTRNMGKGFQ